MQDSGGGGGGVLGGYDTDDLADDERIRDGVCAEIDVN